MAQLVERSLPTPNVRGSNPVIGKIDIEHFLSTVLKRRKEKKKEAGDGPLIFYNDLKNTTACHLGR